MLETQRVRRGMVTAPHHLAAEAGLRVLRDGGNAIEAMVAAAAAIAVVYPHMNGLGGDGFWLIATPDATPPRAVLGVGAAGGAVDAALYRSRGLDAIPARGALAANTVAGTVSGWAAALEISAEWGGRMPLARLFEDAIRHARDGAPVTAGQHRDTVAKRDELIDAPGWADLFLPDDRAPVVGATFRQPALARTFERLAAAGLDDFYRGALARAIAADLTRAGSPLTADDLAAQQGIERPPLALTLKTGTVYNTPPPTQGLASLIILGLVERLGCGEADGFAHVHAIVEATKAAFRVRDRVVTDPAEMTQAPEDFLGPRALDRMAAALDRTRAAPWPEPAQPGDTVWLGAVDGAGRAASFIQSIYWEFGSGVVLPETGIQWQNRGASFTLDPARQNCLKPGRLPFHTINPALARLADGRVMVYGTMGGDGQPQTQAAVYSRHVMFGADLQAAIAAPRWLLGRTWGQPTVALRIEDRFDAAVVAALRAAGHAIEMLPAFSDLTGHAGALVRHPDGLIEGASDPRSDGAAAGF